MNIQPVQDKILTFALDYRIPNLFSCQSIPQNLVYKRNDTDNTMNALINAHSNVGGEPTDSPLSDGLTSNAIPEAERSQTGVSVN